MDDYFISRQGRKHKEEIARTGKLFFGEQQSHEITKAEFSHFAVNLSQRREGGGVWWKIIPRLQNLLTLPFISSNFDACAAVQSIFRAYSEKFLSKTIKT